MTNSSQNSNKYLHSKLITAGQSDKEIFHEANNLLQKKKYKDAYTLYESLTKSDIYQADAYIKLGLISLLQCSYEKAHYFLSKVLEDFPSSIEALFHIGNVYMSQSRYSESISSYKRLITLNDKIPEVFFNLGNALRKTGKTTEAITYFVKALELNPDYFKANLNLALCYQESRDISKSIKFYNHALSLEPDSELALNNLGSLYISCQQYDLASDLIDKALSIKSNFFDAIYNRARIYEAKGDFLQAINYYKRALLYNNRKSTIQASLLYLYRTICKWDEIDEKHVSQLGIDQEPLDPFPFYILEDNPKNHLIRAQRFSTSTYVKSQFIEMYEPKNSRIRVGYFSSDFFNHATMHLMRDFFHNYDSDNYDIYIYAFNTAPDDSYTLELSNSSCIYRDISDLDDIHVLDLVRSDRIDIAVDLKGFTQGNRFSLFAKRLAPIQISYLGFPGTTGSDCIDYILADKILIPEDHTSFYSEKVLWLDGCYQANEQLHDSDFFSPSRSELTLPENCFVFSCFNACCKISATEFDIWLHLLHTVKSSVLWLLMPNQVARRNLLEYAEMRGILSSRIIFAQRLPREQHLVRHKLGDLFLDTFNYNAHTTASDALRSCMPLLTLKGKSFSSRVSSSLLYELGLTELIADNKSQYYDQAYKLATDIQYFKFIKSKLKVALKKSTLYDPILFARKLETIFLDVYNNCQS